MLSILSTPKPGFHAGELKCTWVRQDPFRKNIKRNTKISWIVNSILRFLKSRIQHFLSFKDLSAPPFLLKQNVIPIKWYSKSFHSLSPQPSTQTFFTHLIYLCFSRINSNLLSVFFLYNCQYLPLPKSSFQSPLWHISICSLMPRANTVW